MKCLCRLMQIDQTLKSCCNTLIKLNSNFKLTPKLIELRFNILMIINLKITTKAETTDLLIKSILNLHYQAQANRD